VLDLHRPAVDAITWSCPQCRGTMRRVPEVADAWFDSGSMPVAQCTIPSRTTSSQRAIPADYICEAIDQTRGWFYTLHAVSTLLFDQPCFKNVICLVTSWPRTAARCPRAAATWSTPGPCWMCTARTLRAGICHAGRRKHRRFSANLVKEVVGKFLLTLWNSYSFFVTMPT